MRIEVDDFWGDEAQALSWLEWLTRLDASGLFGSKERGWGEEDVAFACWLEQRDVDEVLELGTGPGHFSALLQRAMAPEGTFRTVDVDQKYPKTVTRLARPGLTVEIFEGSSMRVAPDGTVGWVDPWIDSPPDLIFLDTDHTEESTRREAEIYLPLLAKGGAMAFHDMLNNARTIGVRTVFEELSSAGRGRPLVFHNIPSVHSYGIGVLENV